MPIEPPSRAVEFFEQIIKTPDPAVTIAKLVEEKFGEGEFLDYKNGIQFARDQEGLKATWSKYLSGFANSDGGVLIWGVNAPDNKPDSIALVPDVNKMAQFLMSWIPSATEPPVRGIKIEAIPILPSSSDGFVICLIPPSPWKPHQAKWPHDCQKYYIRVADNCVTASHSLLKSLFQPSSISSVRIHCRTEDTHQPNGRLQLLQIFLINDGPNSASDVCVWYLSEGDGITHVPHYSMWSRTLSASKGNIFIATRSIHPTEKIHFNQFVLGYFDHSGKLIYHADKFTLHCKIFVSNQTPLQYELTLDKESMAASTTFDLNPQ